MKVLCLLLLGVVALSVAPTTNAVQLDRIALESFAKVHGTRCGSLHCPYDNAICCQGKTGVVAQGERKATCCPNGYKCSYPDQRPTSCVRAKAVSVTINPSLSGGSSPSTAAQASAGSMSASTPSMSSAVDPMAGSSSMEGMPSASSMGSASAVAGSASMAMDGSSSAAAPGAVQPQQNVPKFRQNIIIVKNINVLTKLQQPPKGGSASEAPAPQPSGSGSSSQESSSEESSRSEESSSASAESSESGSR